jgi:uncharacterized membrane protein (Fun14 family)
MSGMSDAPGVSSARSLSTFQIVLLVAAIGVAAAGLFGMNWRAPLPPGTPGAPTPETVKDAIERGRSIVSGSPTTEFEPKTADSASTQPWSEWLSTRGVQIGLAFLGGFALGFAFRAFLKTMAILTALAIVTIVLLSYFRVINVDFTLVREQWDSNSEWIIAQGTKLKDLVWQYFPSSTAGVAGLIVGMVRK